MRIVSETKQSLIEINQVDVELTHLPSIEISIEIKDSGFAGCNDEIWIELKELSRFLEQLRDCEQKRVGQALLESMSPEEFQLTVRNIDSSGHFSVRYSLTKRTYNYTQTLIKHELKGEFNLDSEFFFQMVNDFSTLIPENSD